MNNLRLLQHGQRVEQLSRKYSDETRTQSSERVLLNQFVEIVGEELENEAEMGMMNKGILES